VHSSSEQLQKPSQAKKALQSNTVDLPFPFTLASSSSSSSFSSCSPLLLLLLLVVGDVEKNK
jgi:hypothetical protein